MLIFFNLIKNVIVLFVRWHFFILICTQRYKGIYINRCYQCHNDIDSRETNKCSNGLYICPNCLSCCSNELFENQARNYQLKGLTIPQRIQDSRGKGHKEANLYFCNKCGRPMGNIDNNHKCNNCNITFVYTPEENRQIYRITRD